MAENNGILLESGTNELEIVEFCIHDGETPMYCGVNVAKVREIIHKPALRSVVNAQHSVAGMMTLRNKFIFEIPYDPPSCTKLHRTAKGPRKR